MSRGWKAWQDKAGWYVEQLKVKGMTVEPPSPALKAGFQKVGEQLTADWLKKAGADGQALDPRRRSGYRVYREAVRRGALLRPIGDTLYLFPPLTTTPAEIDEMAAILADSLDAVVG